MAQLPSRSKRLGVGKDIGGAIYVHRSYADRLGDVFDNALRHVPQGFDYDVIKHNRQTDAISFVQVTDFDSADEPTVGEILIVTPNGETKRRSPPTAREIYHHKWLFVDDDYTGFDVAHSKSRSAAWIALANVDRKRIGRKRYWEEEVVPRIPRLND